MIGVILSSLLGGLAAGVFFLVYIMRSVERRRQHERRNEEIRQANERRIAVFEEAKRIKAERDAEKAEAREKAKEYLATGKKIPDTVDLSGVYTPEAGAVPDDTEGTAPAE